MLTRFRERAVDLIPVEDRELGLDAVAAWAYLWDSLKPKEQTVLYFVFYCGMSFSKLAKTVGISKNSISVIAAAALRRLRHRFWLQKNSVLKRHLLGMPQWVSLPEPDGRLFSSRLRDWIAQGPIREAAQRKMREEQRREDRRWARVEKAWTRDWAWVMQAVPYPQDKKHGGAIGDLSKTQEGKELLKRTQGRSVVWTIGHSDGRQEIYE